VSNDLRLKEQSHEVIGFRFESVLQDLRFVPTKRWVTFLLEAIRLGILIVADQECFGYNSFKKNRLTISAVN
jgi:hypothetical protein